jgi:hypothetical protein
MFLDADSCITFWAALNLDVESQALDFLECLWKLRIIIAPNNTIIHVDHENNVTTEEDLIINQQRSIAQ